MVGSILAEIGRCLRRTFENYFSDSYSIRMISEYSSVIVWCETFGEFITSAKYK